MHAINQKSFSNSPSLGSKVESGRLVAINTVDSMEKVKMISARSRNERESELENVAVLAYD